MDMSKPRAFVYHPDEEPKMVYIEDKQKWLDQGWFDTPAKFKGVLKTFEVDPEDKAGVQAVGEMIDGVVQATNGALNLDIMTKDELNDYAAVHLPDLDIKQKTPIGTMRRMIKKAIE